MPRDDLPGNDVPDADVDPAVIERLTAIAGEMGADDFALLDPPPDLWDRIAAAVDESSAAQPPVDQPLEAEGDATEGGGGEGGAAPVDDEPAPVVPLGERRRRMNRSIVVAVAASILVFVALGVLFTRGESSPDPQLVASATLAPVDGVDVGDAGADVRLVENGDDVRLVLSAHDMAAAPSGHHYELWLLDRDDGQPVSLGAMGGSVSVPVPADVDLETYDVVDVSIQAEGQAEHSGESILRGTLA